MPTPITTNNANESSAYLTRPFEGRGVRLANAIESSAAKSKYAVKWLGAEVSSDNQALRPMAISKTSNTPIQFTTPAAAMNLVP